MSDWSVYDPEELWQGLARAIPRVVAEAESPIGRAAVRKLARRAVLERGLSRLDG